MSLINTALWHYLGTKDLDFKHENNSTPGVLIEEIWYVHITYVYIHMYVYAHTYTYTHTYIYTYKHT